MEGFEMAFALGRSVLGPAIGGAVLGGMAMLAGKMLSNKRNIHQPGDGAAVRSGEGSVRSAGPTGMRTEPAKWTKEDEASDESFPASDPPGQGVG